MPNFTTDYQTVKCAIEYIKHLFFFAIIPLTIITCSDSEEIIQKTCIPQSPESLFVPICDEVSYDTSLYCKPIHAGSFSLSDVSKSYIPHYCNNEFSTLDYVNQQGDQISFELKFKQYSTSTQTWLSGDSCNSKGELLCYETEYVSLHLESKNPDLLFRISIGILPGTFSHAGQVGEYLNIQRFISDSITRVYNNFVLLTDDTRLDNPDRSREEFYNRIMIAGQNFEEIYSYKNYPTTIDPYKFFYSTEDGIVGFVDDMDVEWHIIN